MFGNLYAKQYVKTYSRDVRMKLHLANVTTILDDSSNKNLMSTGN